MPTRRSDAAAEAAPVPVNPREKSPAGKTAEGLVPSPAAITFLLTNMKGAEMAEGKRLTCLACGQANRVAAERIDAGPKCGTCGVALVTGKVADIDLATLEKAAKDDGLPLLVDFWAPWCGPCRAMAPDFAKAADHLRGRARLAKVNTDLHPDAAVRFGIRGIPALHLFAGGRELARTAGARPVSGIVAFVTQAVARA